MYRILAIGNSFSEDATYFLHQILENSGIQNEVINLYIGGCSLEQHWRNIETQSSEYQFQINGVRTERYVSIQEVLNEGSFDVIVTQQASGDSGWENTYEPFLDLIVDYLNKHSIAKLYLNQTWAYESDSNHSNFMRYRRNQQQMFTALVKAYEDAARRHNLPLIRCGEMIQKIREMESFKTGKQCITRDGFHMNYLYGRYAVALLWAKKLIHIDVADNDFVPKVDFMSFGDADAEILSGIKRIVGGME